MKLCGGPARSSAEALHEALRRLCTKLCRGSTRSSAYVGSARSSAEALHEALHDGSAYDSSAYDSSTTEALYKSFVQSFV